LLAALPVVWHPFRATDRRRNQPHLTRERELTSSAAPRFVCGQGAAVGGGEGTGGGDLVEGGDGAAGGGLCGEVDEPV